MSRILPSFIISGGNNSGTSYLFSFLTQHPEIFLPAKMRPEPSFFFKSWEYEKGIDYYSKKWFYNVPKTINVIGEKSSNYLYGSSFVAKRISKCLPNVKLIFVLRNPVERTWANYRFTVLHGLENLSFIEALQNEKERTLQESGSWREIQPHNYTERGFYAKHLNNFFKHFSPSQIHIIESDQLAHKTGEELKKTYDFLKLEDMNFNPVTPPLHTSVSVIDPSLQMELRNYFGEKFDLIIEEIRKERPITGMAQNDVDAEMIIKLRNNLKRTKDKMPISARHYLHKLFAEDMKMFKGMVNIDIDHWF